MQDVQFDPIEDDDEDPDELIMVNFRIPRWLKKALEFEASLLSKRSKKKIGYTTLMRKILIMWVTSMREGRKGK